MKLFALGGFVLLVYHPRYWLTCLTSEPLGFTLDGGVDIGLFVKVGMFEFWRWR